MTTPATTTFPGLKADITTGKDHPDDLTPTYSEHVYLADVGRRLLALAGYDPSQRPPAEIVARSLRFPMPEPTLVSVMDGAIDLGDVARLVRRKP